MALREIVGQEKAISMLQGILRRRRLAGAYLFCGEPGIGKRTIALNFAKAVNCTSAGRKLPEGIMPDADQLSSAVAVDACDTCASCLKVNAAIHPDVLTITPEERQIRIEEIRAIEEALSFRPFEGKKKVVIVDDADTMNQSAANALLKTLEEPPEDSLIILIASRPDRLPSTIRSRCSRIMFQTLPLASCRTILKDKTPANELEQVVRLTLGRPGLSLASGIMQDRDWFVNLLQAMMRNEKDGWASREEMEKWFDLSLIFIRDLAVLKMTGRQTLLINADLEAELARLGKSAGLQGIIELYKELSFIKVMLLFNLNKSLTWNYTASLLRKELLLRHA
jgi:DNA polymerase-3 subunit delta'